MSEIDRALDSFLDEDDELSNEDLPNAATRSGWIFLVDCTSTMLGLGSSGPSNLTGFQLAVQCCQTFQQNKAIVAPRDLVGLVFMRTRQSSSADLKNIYVMQALNTINPPRILELDEILHLSPAELMSRYGTLGTESFDFYQALWTCQNMFSKSSNSMGHRQIFLFTDDPDPVNGRPHAKRQVFAKMSDICQSGIVMEVLPIKSEGIAFDFTLFYKDLLSNGGVGNIDSPLPLADPADRIEQLLTRVRSLELPQRRVASLMFHLGPDSRMSLGVSVYCLLRRTAVPPGIRISANDNLPVTAHRSWYKVTKPGGGFDPQQDLLQPHDIIRGIKIGSRHICFESDELDRAMEELAPVGLFLLGFKPMKELKRHYHIRPPQFIYPNDSLVRGSRMWFSLLLHVCIRRELFALAIYVQRKRTAPRLVALVPQTERLDSDGSQLYPPGFLLVFLPYADDFRNCELPPAALASEEQVTAAKSMIRKLTVPFDPRQIHNPVLQRHYAMLEALALNKEFPAEVIDETLPNISAINRRAASEIEVFKDVCGLGNSDYNKQPPTKFEPRSQCTLAPEMTKDYIRTLFEGGKLHTLPMQRLRQALMTLNSTPSGRTKKDLIDQIANHFR